MHIFTYLGTFLISLKMNGITFQMFCQCAVSSIWEFNYLAVLLNQKNWLVFLGPRFSWINFENNKKAKLIGKYSSQMIISRSFYIPYSLISTRQLHIFSIKPKLDMQLFVDFYVSTRFGLNLSDRNLKLFWTSIQNNFRFRSRKFSQKRLNRNQQTITCQLLAKLNEIWSCLI